MAAVIGIIGYTHGVRLVSTPPANSAGSASAGLPFRSCVIEPSGTVRDWAEAMDLTGGLLQRRIWKVPTHNGGAMSSMINAMRGRSVRLALLLTGVAVPLLGAARAVGPATSLHM